MTVQYILQRGYIFDWPCTVEVSLRSFNFIKSRWQAVTTFGSKHTLFMGHIDVCCQNPWCLANATLRHHISLVRRNGESISLTWNFHSAHWDVNFVFHRIRVWLVVYCDLIFMCAITVTAVICTDSVHTNWLTDCQNTRVHKYDLDTVYILGSFSTAIATRWTFSKVSNIVCQG